jgi:uncharacterized membrane protein
LLFPPLQAANIADFHADPFVVLPLLLAFWYATQKRWVWMWFWAIVAMLTKENLPTLTAMLGLYLIFDFYRSKRDDASAEASGNDRVQLKHGLALVAISITWFLIATFLIVGPLASEHFGTSGPIYLANRFDGGLAGLLLDENRWRYVLGLLAAVGFLSLLAPELLILGLPILLANFLSNFPGQYSGEQHYSAPLVVAFLLAAIFGVRRLVDRTSLRESNDWPLKKITLIAACLWLLGWSIGFHSRFGWTPLSVRTEAYQTTPATTALPEFIKRIPPQVPVSASAAIHPHVAHRRQAYVFPLVGNAEYLLVDVTDIPGVHPNDAYAQIVDMLQTNWRLIEADQGLILAKKATPISTPTDLPCRPNLPFPCTFFDFVRPAGSPSFPANLAFGDGQLRLVGYDVLDDPDDGVTFRFYWQGQDALPEDLRLWPLIYDDLGQLLMDPTHIPMISTIWYPPSAWPTNAVIITETLPQLLPDSFHLGLAAGVSADSFYDTNHRWPINSDARLADQPMPGHWVQLASFTRQGPFLTHLEPVVTLQPLVPVEARFGPVLRLAGFWLSPDRSQPGSTLPVVLQWVADAPPPADYTVFIHLVAPDGSLVAQSDAVPTWLTPQPTSRWPLNRPVIDAHTITLPADLPADTYSLLIGLYHSTTLNRLVLTDGSDTLELTKLDIK